MTIKLSMPSSETQLKPRITVIGVGGAGGNAVNNMIDANLEGVDFLVCNTDSQALEQSIAENKIQLGVSITQGLGAGARPEVGQAAAEEVMDEILDQMLGSHMVFVTAGMGGGTGTGAAPVIARTARENGMLTVGVVTKPFHFEGAQRMRIAEQGIEELTQYVDTLIIIPNQNLFRIANEKTTFAEAFNLADEVLHSGVRGVTDLMVMPGLINLDFADIRTVMSEMGKAMMGTGEADGDDRAIRAAESAISNPLLDDITMEGARGVLINITGGPDITLYEVDEAANRIRQEVDGNANILFGSTFEESMEGKIRVSVVATGIDADSASKPTFQPRLVTDAVSRPKPSASAEPASSGNAPAAVLEPTPIERAVAEASKVETDDAEEPAADITASLIEPAEEDVAAEIRKPEPVPAAAEVEKPSALDAAIAATPDDNALDMLTRPPFIPPRPADSGEKEPPARRPADPFNDAAYANARSDYQEPRKEKRKSLFQRLAGVAKRSGFDMETHEDNAPSGIEQFTRQTYEPAAPMDRIEPVAAPKPDPIPEPKPEPVAEAEPLLQRPAEPKPAEAVEDTLPAAPEPEIEARQEAEPEEAPKPVAEKPAPARTMPPMPKPAIPNPAASKPAEPLKPAAKPASAPKPMPAPRPAAQAAAVQPKPASEEFELSNVEEEMLEIPAFLRRQAN
jgi:cell division protein FtsZ